MCSFHNVGTVKALKTCSPIYYATDGFKLIYFLMYVDTIHKCIVQILECSNFFNIESFNTRSDPTDHFLPKSINFILVADICSPSPFLL